MDLPRTVGVWSRAEAPKTIGADRIFDYMDGAGELYLAYRFSRLDAYDYASRDQGSIVVELYWMETSDDAFGLLSGDWGGEPVALGLRTPAVAALTVPPHRALYGAGLLRVWSDNLYARVLASNETSASRQAVLDLGRAIVADRKTAAAPGLVSVLPRAVEPSYRLRVDRVWYLRSNLVLNSAYFLSTENLLDLDGSTEAVVGEYAGAGTKPGEKPVHAIVVRYVERGAAAAALAHFKRGYLSGVGANVGDTIGSESGFARIEDGWTAYRLAGRSLVLAFGCHDRALARAAVDGAARILANMESGHDE